MNTVQQHTYKMRVDLGSSKANIPNILKYAARGMRKHGDHLNIQAIWRYVITKNLSYLEALEVIGVYVNIVDPEV